MNNALGNRTGPDRSGVGLFTPYRIDNCFSFAKATSLESKRVITRFSSKNGADPLNSGRSHQEGSVPKTYPTRNVSLSESERSSSKSSQKLCRIGGVKCEQEYKNTAQPSLFVRLYDEKNPFIKLYGFTLSYKMIRIRGGLFCHLYASHML